MRTLRLTGQGFLPFNTFVTTHIVLRIVSHIVVSHASLSEDDEELNFRELWKALRPREWKALRPRGIDTLWRYVSPSLPHTDIQEFLGEGALMQHARQHGWLNGTNPPGDYDRSGKLNCVMLCSRHLSYS